MQIRRAKERGYADHGWLRSFHTFSFAGYYDPEHMGFGALRVINQDRVAGGQGFGSHGHEDMEIVSYVLDGALAHKDSIGGGGTIRPGDVQRMTAGTGVIHSEFNASPDDEVHFLQIWIVPEKKRLPPSYEQKAFPEADRRGQLRLIASRDARDGALTVHQDVDIYASVLDAADRATLELRPGRRAWIHVARGKVTVNDTELGPGDAVGITEAGPIALAGVDGAELLLFDLA